MEKTPTKIVSELGSRLLQLSRPNKDSLIKSLREVAAALSQIEQPIVTETANKKKALKLLETELKPLKKSIIKHGLLKNRDNDVSLLVTVCVTEIFRILAPEPPFEDKYLRDIFSLFLAEFSELADTGSPYFSKRAKILETVSRCKCSLVMLDVECHDLIHDMFKIFFSVVREHHQQSLINHKKAKTQQQKANTQQTQQSLFNDILTIMIDILKEETSSSLVNIILENLVKEGKDATPAANNLASSLIESCTDTLEPLICSFLTSCFREKDSIQSNLKDSYHEIVFMISLNAPQILLAVIPNLTQELLTDQVDVRMKALNLAGRIFAQPKHCFGGIYQDLFAEFLRRFSDKSAEVRMAALKCGKQCYMANPSGNKASGVLIAIQERLLDFDDRVRTQALVVACDIMKFNMKYVPSNLISEASERLRDKKICVRKKALQKLTEVYQDYCDKCSQGYMTINDHFEQIPCKILLLCCDKDSEEFRPQNMEIVLSDDLFPRLLPIEDRMRHWVQCFAVMNHIHLRSLSSILSQKRRLQNELRHCLILWGEAKDKSVEEVHRKHKSYFVKLSACFPDASKAEELFHKLDQTRDTSIFDALSLLLDELTFTKAQSIREKFLKTIGAKHHLFEFLRVLSTKCSPTIFSSEHVQYLLNELCSSTSVNTQYSASIKLLLVILNMFPSYLRGSEEQFLKLLKENDYVADKLTEALSKAAPYISVNFGDYYPVLEKMCLEGTRSQAKYAVSAIASLAGSSDKFVFSELCEMLIDSLVGGRNIPTTLQSLACVGQHSVLAFDNIYEDISSYIYQGFQAEPSDSQPPCDQATGCCDSCKLKIYGLKTLVKSFLPRHGKVVRKIDDLLNILKKTLKSQGFDGIKSCTGTGANVRLAAAKAVLLLSRKWDLHISPETFRLTILMGKESDPFITRNFLTKLHKLLTEHMIPSRYACAFSFSASGPCRDLQIDSFRYINEFIRNTTREARGSREIDQRESLTDCPAYMIVFLIQVLAHDPEFPSEDCRDEHVYARFCGPLLSVLQVLLSNKETAPFLVCIFRAIKRAEDAVKASKTPRLHILADIGYSAVKTLNCMAPTSPQAPRSVLLPSSLYKLSPASMSDNQECTLQNKAKSHTRSSLEKSFIERVVHIFQSQISLHDQRCEEKTPAVVSENTDLPLLLGNQIEASMTGSTEASKNNIRCSRKRPHLGLPEKSTNSRAKKKDSSKRCKTVEGAEHISRNSSSLRTVESEIPIKKLERHSTGSKESVGASVSNNDTSAKHSKVETALKDISNNGEAIIGQRIKLLSPTDGCFYPGTVEKFNSKSNSHKIAFDNGDVELVCLDSESWETLSHESMGQQETLGKETESFGSRNCVPEITHTHAKTNASKQKTTTKQQNKKLSTKLNQAAANSMNVVSGEASVSEVTNTSDNIGLRRSSRRQRIS